MLEHNNDSMNVPSLWYYIHPCWKINSFLSEISVCRSCTEKIIKIERAVSVILRASPATCLTQAPLEFFFQEQSYFSLHSGRSLAWDHVRGDIDDPCGAIADFCGVIADPCGVVAIHEAIGGRRSLCDSLNIIKHC